MNEKSPLGRLERVELRKYWEREDTEFTPWLGKDENIALLGQTIGLDLEVQTQEASVGPFRADILCRNTTDNSLVLIENQLERTDHTHLGQLFTYAAGLDAVSVVWVARHFTEEHRAALDWLNRITREGFNFFGLEIELWRIGESVPAPKFDVVVQPNDWSKIVKEVADSSHGPLTPAQQLWMDYWREFGEFLESTEASFSTPKPQKSHWVTWGLGRAGFGIMAIVSSRDRHVDVELRLDGNDSKAHFHLLHARKDEIETELGFSVEWLEKPELKGSSISVTREAETTDRNSWPDLHAWTLGKMAAFDRVFRPLVRGLDASEWEALDRVE